MTMFNSNPLLAVDSYKFSHHNLLPPGTTHINSYIESRGGVLERTVFFGLQAWLMNLNQTPVTMAHVKEAEEVATAHGLPFLRSGFERLVTVHKGRWPVEIEAVAEGTVMPTGQVLVQMRNTDPEMPWVVSFLETSLLRGVWYPTTVASLSRAAKALIRSALETSSDDPGGQILFRLHDFGARGVSSAESAALGGMAHLVNFRGSDTVEALVSARRYYGESMAGFSIPASEHSVISAWGREGETAAYENMLEHYGKPGAMFACVSDSWNIYRATSDIWGGTLRDKVLASGATLVVRPDSGNPLTVPVEVIQRLGERFGFTVNRKGYRVLNPAVRVIQGDGITLSSIPQILENLLAAGWSAENLAFGMGSGLLQQVNRDTMNFAMKASAMRVNGEWQGVRKDPVTDSGKRSKEGVLSLVQSSGIGHSRWMTIPRAQLMRGQTDYLVPVYRDGELLVKHSFGEIRDRSESQLT